MVKKVLLISFLVLVFFSLIPDLDLSAANPCSVNLVGNPDSKTGRYEIKQFKEMLQRIVDLILFCITPPIAVLMLVIGGIIILVSGGDPNLKSLGKKILIATIIGLFIAYGSWAIIRFILIAIGTKSQYLP